MSRVCELTGKKAMNGNKISHSNRKSGKTWNVNLQTVTLDIDGKKTKVKASTRAIKTLKKA